MTLKLGYKASAEQFAPRQLLDFSVAAEHAGFDSVFVSDHFQPWRHTDGHAPSALAWLGALGASTQRIVMGTSVLTPTFRYHPSVVAQAFGTLGAIPVCMLGFVVGRHAAFILALVASQCALVGGLGSATAAVQMVTPPEMRGRMGALLIFASGLLGYGGGSTLGPALTFGYLAVVAWVPAAHAASTQTTFFEAPRDLNPGA